MQISLTILHVFQTLKKTLFDSSLISLRLLLVNFIPGNIWWYNSAVLTHKGQLRSQLIKVNIDMRVTFCDLKM